MINNECPEINDEYYGSSKINMINKWCPRLNDKKWSSGINHE